MSAGESVTLPDGLARNIIHGWPDDWKYDDDFDEDAYDRFVSDFEFVTNRALGDPKESWYQGVTFTAVIRRRSDGQKFGFSYWESISKHGEPYYEPNGDNDEYVFYPVTEFPVHGYEVQTPKEDKK